MAFNITQFGRVEFDPMSVPSGTVAGSEYSTDESFELELDQATRSFDADGQTGELAQREPESSDSKPEQAPARDESGSRADDGDTKPAPSRRDDAQPAETVEEPTTAPTPVGANANQIQEGEAPVQGRNAGKGTGSSPSTFSPDVTFGAATQTATSNLAKHAAATTLATAPVAQTNATQAAPNLREAVSATQKVATAEAPVGYRTLHLPTLTAAEVARDSIFRQIALQLTPDGGEMNVLLDPPQLGELAMKLVVDGDKLRLTVIAERPEVAAMMQKHLAELRQHLETQGLTVTEADVRARDPHEQHQREAARDGSRHANHDEQDAADTPDLSRMKRGFITAEGLDFWI